MNTNSFHNEYFKWMSSLVQHNNYSPSGSYNKLLKALNNVIFEYNIPMDGNRADDGIELRYRFGFIKGYSDHQVAMYLDISPCSILEMMIALSLRCEEQIMDDPDLGNRTSKWFWDMISSLGLSTMNDINFSNVFVDNKINIFLNHEYAKNGRGGLFTLNNPPTDLREVEIWYQMNWYLYELGEK